MYSYYVTLLNIEAFFLFVLLVSTQWLIDHRLSLLSYTCFYYAT